MTAEGQGKKAQKDRLRLDAINWEGANEHGWIITKLPETIAEGSGDWETEHLPNLDADVEDNEVSPRGNWTEYWIELGKALTAEKTETT